MSDKENTPEVRRENEVGGWGTLEHQQVFSYYTISPDDVRDGRNVYVLEGERSIEPLDGGIRSGQEAELVSLDVTILKGFVAPTGNEGSDPGLVMIEAELSFDSESMIQATIACCSPQISQGQ